MACKHCGRDDHPGRAHRDPEAAIEAGDEARARGQKTIALMWYEVARKLANSQKRELRGIRG